VRVTSGQKKTVLFGVQIEDYGKIEGAELWERDAMIRPCSIGMSG